MDRIEDLQFAGLRFLQNDRVFPFGTDAVLLASFCRAGAKDTVVDLGTGSGILPILLYGRTRARIIGIEIQEEAAALAKRNVALNHAQDRISILQGDLREAPALIREKVSVVVCNPPYDKLGTGGVSQRDAHRVARHEVACSLEDVVKSAAGLLQTGGNFYLIHRASRLAELCDVLRRHRLEPKLLRLVAPRAGREPNYLLLQSKKDAAPSLRILPTLLIQEQGGVFTRELREIYHMED